MKNLIAITTYNRPRILDLCLSQIAKCKDDNDVVFVYDDGSLEVKNEIVTFKNKELNEKICNDLGFKYVYNFERAKYIKAELLNETYPENFGIARAKNICLDFAKKIKATNIILLDDDTFPIKKGFFDYLNKTAETTKENHFILSEHENNPPVKQFELTRGYKNAEGRLLYITNKVIDYKIFFDENFGKYGYEHVKWSLEIFKQKLNTLAVFQQPSNLCDYFTSFDLQDYQGSLKENNIDFKCSLSVEERQNALNISEKIWKKYIK